MSRLYRILRLLAIAIASPVLLICVVLATVLSPMYTLRSWLHTPLRLWMNIVDWVNGTPVGYSYWVRYLAPVMLDEIVVHHHEDSSS